MTDSLPGAVVVLSTGQTAADRAVEEQLCAAGLVVRPSCASSAFDACRQCDVLVVTPSARDAAVADARRSGFAGAILVVGRSSDPSEVVAALEGGADDYVALSCAPTELVARVRALVRRAGTAGATRRDVGGLALDLQHGVLRADGAEVALTRREADLLDYLARHAGRPVTRAELAEHIWQTTADPGSTNVVDVYVSYLRRKLGAVGRQSLIRSVRGVGYELVDTRAG